MVIGLRDEREAEYRRCSETPRAGRILSAPPWFNRPRNPSNPDPDGIDQSQTWQAPEIHLDDERILLL
jgi:hypothetical protein